MEQVNKWPMRCFGAFLLAVLGYVAPAGASSGMVMAVKGKVLSNDASRPVVAMTPVSEGDELDVASGSLVVITDYLAGRVGRVTGPAKIKVLAGGIESTPPEKTVWTSVKGGAFSGGKDVRRTSGDIRLRSFDPKPVFPEEAEALVAPRVRFEWRGAPKVHLLVKQLGSGDIVFDGVVESAERISSEIQLTSGMSYSWCVRQPVKAECSDSRQLVVMNATQVNDLGAFPRATDSPGLIAEYVYRANKLSAWRPAQTAAQLLVE